METPAASPSPSTSLCLQVSPGFPSRLPRGEVKGWRRRSLTTGGRYSHNVIALQTGDLTYCGINEWGNTVCNRNINVRERVAGFVRL
eukprot:767818-Hanusia_phi.AAC.3